MKDQWEDMPYEVEHQVAIGVPLYIMKDVQGQSWILHLTDFLSSLCVSVCTTQTQCTSSTLDEPTPEGSEIEEPPQQSDCLVPTLHQASKTPLGCINGKLCAVLWMSARTSIQDQG